MKRILAALAAAGVLVAGAFVATAVTSDAASAQAIDDATATEEEKAERRAVRQQVRGFLEDDVISSDELAQLPEDHPMRDEEGPFADALSDGQITRDELEALHEERRAAREAIREQVRGFLEDDVISSDELAQLPEDHPMRDEEGPFADALSDGQITRDELESLHEERRAAREQRREERRAHREQVREYLEDDVIDADELAELGDDHPFNDPDGRFADAAADGQITLDELEELKPERRPHRFGRGGPGSDSAASGEEAGLSA